MRELAFSVPQSTVLGAISSGLPGLPICGWCRIHRRLELKLGRWRLQEPLFADAATTCFSCHTPQKAIYHIFSTSSLERTMIGRHCEACMTVEPAAALHSHTR
jgi:hypothetical protein